jgi:sulfur relay protein TusB/DsrH
MANIIYLFGYSLKNSTQFTQVLPLIKTQLTKGAEVELVLMHDAVIGTTTKGTTPKSLKELLNFAFQMKNVGNVTGIEPTVKLHISVLRPDYEARGLLPEMILSNLQLISYGQLVDNMDAAGKVVSWL